MVNRPVNFRDLGGLKTEDERCVQRCRLLRSGEVTGLSSSDRHILYHDYDLRQIVDFRSAFEVENAPDDVLEGVAYINIDVLKNDVNLGPGKKRFEALTSKGELIKLMQQFYAIAILDRDAQRGYRQFLDLLLRAKEGATLFHCFAGKDRTGIAAAIILTILNVPEETIFEDYLLTNAMRAEHNEQLAAEARANGKDEREIFIYQQALLVRGEYLAHVMEVATEQYGSFDRYITEALQVNAAERALLQALYLSSS